MSEERDDQTDPSSMLADYLGETEEIEEVTQPEQTAVSEEETQTIDTETSEEGATQNEQSTQEQSTQQTAESKTAQTTGVTQTQESQETPEQVNARLLAQLNEMSQRLMSGQPEAQPTVVSQVKTQQTAEQTQQLRQQDMLELVSAEDFDAALTSHEGMNKLMNQVYSRATMDVLQRMPVVVTALVQQQVTAQRAVEDFYRENDDLLPYASFVGYVTNELEAKHPNKPLKELLTEVNTEVRKRLNKQKQAAARQTAKQSTAPTTQARKAAPPALSRVEQEIADMLADV